MLHIDDMRRAIAEPRAVEDAVIALDAVAAMTPKQRVALWLCLMGYTQEEAGNILGIDQRNVGRRIQRSQTA